MDAFYASVEQMDNPKLKGKPVAVGGSRERGVVAAASYEARKYGVKSAMPSILAYRQCPDIIFVKPRFERYKEISQSIRSIFSRYSDLIEPLSLDEAYLDVTQDKKGIQSAFLVAEAIRKDILDEVGLTASAGVSFNKFLAKIASDLNKPNGIALITPDKAQEFVDQLTIDKFFGIGKVTAGKMRNMGIHNGADLKTKSKEFLVEHFGKAGKHYFNIVRLIDNRAVQPNRIRKSLGAERTFSEDIEDDGIIIQKLEAIAKEVYERVQKAKLQGRTITLKIKYKDFTLKTRSNTLNEFIDQYDEILNYSIELYRSEPLEMPVRLMGISISNFFIEEDFDKETGQLKLKFKRPKD
ncbi:MAG: DNA polymerase IV [Flavobacteriales bacterium]|nr:DNA polymerase IV [Flavobacteriales bacterium]